jgi:hypothetical protein
VLVRRQAGERDGGQVVAKDAAEEAAHVVSIGTMFLRQERSRNPWHEIEIRAKTSQVQVNRVDSGLEPVSE